MLTYEVKQKVGGIRVVSLFFLISITFVLFLQMENVLLDNRGLFQLCLFYSFKLNMMKLMMMTNYYDNCDDDENDEVIGCNEWWNLDL